MKNIIILITISLLLTACKSYVQVCNTNSSIKTNEDGFFIYENDSLKITYSFWKAKGLMSFSIYNKMSIPLYIDWKKSSYVDNSVKLNYWIDEEKSTAISSYGSYFYGGPLLTPGNSFSTSSSVSNSSKVKAERITFIPPASYYYRSQFYILPKNYFKLNTKSDCKEVIRNDNYNKTTKIYTAVFTKDNSPLIFRNFLTFSTTENFETEFYVDNEFYIVEIIEMNSAHFEQYRYDETKKGKWYIRDENGEPIRFSEYKRPSSFYLEIPKESSIEYRK
jgi:hypothetical protein